MIIMEYRQGVRIQPETDFERHWLKIKFAGSITVEHDDIGLLLYFTEADSNLEVSDRIDSLNRERSEYG